MTRYLVTGGAGFIGSNIVEELVKRDDYVRVLDNLSTGKLQNISSFIDKDNFEFIEGDLRNYQTVQEAVKDIDYILHHGAISSVPQSMDDPITTNDVNINGTLNVLNASLKAKVKRVIFASSASIYGNGSELPKREDMKPSPESPYAISKYAGERYCQTYTKLHGLETVCLRYFNVFGPRQDSNSQYSGVIPKFINLLKDGKNPIVYGDGDASRDFVYVSNIVNANLLACTAKGAVGQAYNIACGEGITINYLVKKLMDLFGNNIRPIYEPSKRGDIKHSYASIEKAKRELGYVIDKDFDSGILATISAYQ